MDVDGLSPSAREHRNSTVMSVAAVVLTCVVIVAGAAALATIEHGRAHRDERTRDAEVLAEVLASLDSVRDVLLTTDTARSLIDPPGLSGGGGVLVDEDRFQRYASALTTHPTVSSVAYEQRVTDDERADFERATGIVITERDASRALVPAAVRERYYPIVHFAPSSDSAPLGFDVASEDRRRTALERAIATGAPTASAPVRTNPDDRLGVLVLTPLTPAAVDAAVPPDAGTTGDEPIGLLSVAYYADELANEVRPSTPGASVEIRDEDTSLVAIGTAPDDGATAEVEVLGRQWSVSARHPERASLTPAIMAAAAGLLLALVVAVIGGSFISQQRRLEAARRRTELLQAATAELAKCELPEAVRSCAIAQAQRMLSAEHVAFVTRSATGVLVTDATTRAPADGQPVEAAEQPGALESPGDPDVGLDPPRDLGVDLDRDEIAPAIDADEPSRLAAGPGEVVVVPVPGVPEGRSVMLLALPDGRRAAAADVELCSSLAVVVGAAMRRAHTHQLEHRMAETLQRQLMSPTLPWLPRMTLAAVYEPAATRAGVGGDWYDVVQLERHRSAITIGDVVGHGIRAAGAMGQLRTAFRSLAGILPPAAILERLDGLAGELPGAFAATALHVELDTEQLVLRYCVAGHPPPLLVNDDGATFLWGARGAPIGCTVQPRYDAEVHVARGDRLVVYTDGLVERRNEVIDVGLERLAAVAVATRPLPTHRACRALFDRLVVGDSADDTAVVVVTIDR